MTSSLVPSLAVITILSPPAGPGPRTCPTCPAPGTNAVARLQHPRSAQTATLLPSGTILVVGGMQAEGGTLASAELFDPRTNSVTPTTSLRTPRASHTATLLPDGRVLIAGGYNGEYLATVEIYDPRTGSFSPGGTLNQARSGHTATLFPDGSVLMAGGVGVGWSFLASAELYDPRSGMFEPVGRMSTARESHTATLTPRGLVLVAGGHRGRRDNLEVYASAELYDPATRTFRRSGDLTIPRHKHDAVSLADGRVLILGGADRTDRGHYASTELYDPASEQFVRGPDMRFARYKISGASVRLPDGRVVVAGGGRSAEVSDVGVRGFQPVAGDFGVELAFATATLAMDGDVILIGGYDERNVSSATVWRVRLEKP